MSRRDPNARADRKQTFTGRYVTVAEPSSEQVDLLDIAMALPHVYRFDGSTINDDGWSVLNHQRLAGMIARVMITDADRLLPGMACGMAEVFDAQMHDAHEYVIGDLTSPTKAGIDMRHPDTAAAINHLKGDWDRAIYAALRLPWQPPAIRSATAMRFVKNVDHETYTVESKLFMRNGWEGYPWPEFHQCARRWAEMGRHQQAEAWLHDLHKTLVDFGSSTVSHTIEIIQDTLVRIYE